MCAAMPSSMLPTTRGATIKARLVDGGAWWSKVSPRVIASTRAPTPTTSPVVVAAPCVPRRGGLKRHDLLSCGSLALDGSGASNRRASRRERRPFPLRPPAATVQLSGHQVAHLLLRPQQAETALVHTRCATAAEHCPKQRAVPILPPRCHTAHAQDRKPTLTSPHTV